MTHCSDKAFERATAEAKALADMLGDGWEPQAWENIGWHYRAIKGFAAVRPQRTGSFVSGEWTTHGYNAVVWTTGRSFSVNATDPRDALGGAVHAARNYIERMKQELDALL